jgi:hypothetical protein
VTATPTASEALLHRHCDEVWSQGNLDVVDEIFHPDCVNHLMPRFEIEDGRGRAGIKALVGGIRQAVSDLRVVPLRIWSSDEKGFLCAWGQISGRHTGEVWGIAPTHRRILSVIVAIYELREGLLYQEWAIGNDLELYRQITTHNRQAVLNPETFPRFYFGIENGSEAT